MNKIKLLFNKKNLPFIFLFFMMLIIHSYTNFSNDDLYFSAQLDHQNIFEFLSMRYNTWSSRLIIEIFSCLFSSWPINIWRIIDSIVYVFIAIMISKIFNENKIVQYNWIIILFMLLYPICDLSSAGWVATTTNYSWPFATLLFVLYLIKQIVNEKNLGIITKFLGIICTFITISQEQTCSLLIGFTILAFFKIICQKKYNIKKHFYIIFILVLALSYLIFTLTCPGNHIRFEKELSARCPEYNTFTIVQKLYLGIVSTMAIFINNKIVVTLFSILLCFLTFKIAKNNCYKNLSLIIVSFFLLFGPLINITKILFPNLMDFVSIMKDKHALEFNSLTSIMPLLSIMFIIISTSILLIICFKKNYLPVTIYLAGWASRIIMGFSPTIFASSERTSFFMYFSLLILCFCIYQKIVEFPKTKSINYLNTTIIVLSLLNFMNIIYSFS